MLLSWEYREEFSESPGSLLFSIFPDPSIINSEMATRYSSYLVSPPFQIMNNLTNPRSHPPAGILLTSTPKLIKTRRRSVGSRSTHVKILTLSFIKVVDNIVEK